MIDVILYSREDCHLCEQAIADLSTFQQDFQLNIVVIDVDSTKELQREYGFEVPVVKAGPYTLKAPFGLTELKMTLGAAQDRLDHIEKVENSPALAEIRQRETWSSSDSFSYWISKHYMALFNSLVLIYVGLPFLAPILMKSGMTQVANLIYRPYSLVCHQLAYRSLFIFGEQAVYPRASAEVDDLLTFSKATGLGEGSSVQDVFAARSFVGNDQLGYKVALCERDIAIYGGILLFGIIFSLTGKKLLPLPWYMWIIFGIIPIGVDGLSQLLSQPPFNFWNFRESTPFFRSLTGGLFGFMTAWFGYPLVEESMVNTRELMEAKKRRIKQRDQLLGQ